MLCETVRNSVIHIALNILLHLWKQRVPFYGFPFVMSVTEHRTVLISIHSLSIPWQLGLYCTWIFQTKGPLFFFSLMCTCSHSAQSHAANHVYRDTCYVIFLLFSNSIKRLNKTPFLVCLDLYSDVFKPNIQMSEYPYQKWVCLMSLWLLANAKCNIHKGKGATTMVWIKLANMTDWQHFTVCVKASFLRKVIIKWNI